MPNRQTHGQTDRQTMLRLTSVAMHAMEPNNKNPAKTDNISDGQIAKSQSRAAFNLRF